MKPLFFLLTVALLATACRKTEPAPLAVPPVAKQITFDVFAGQDYSTTAASPYGYKAASVKLMLKKSIKDGNQQDLWDTTFSYRPLVEYPMPPQQYQIIKTVTIAESKEQLDVSYEILYGSLYDAPQRFIKASKLANGQNTLNLNVAL